MKRSLISFSSRLNSASAIVWKQKWIKFQVEETVKSNEKTKEANERYWLLKQNRDFADMNRLLIAKREPYRDRKWIS